MSEPEKEILKDSKLRYILRIGEYIGSSARRAVPIFALIGILISYQFKLTMNKDAWFWFFSSIAQTFSALVALVAVFLIFRLELYDAKIVNNIKMIRNLISIPELGKDLNPKYLTVDKLVLYHADNILRKYKTNDVYSVETFPPNLTLDIISMIDARTDIDKLKQKKQRAKGQMKILLEPTVFIIIMSISLIPFGSVNIEDSLMLALWNNYHLKWAVIFGVVGLCFASLFKVKSILNETLSEEE